jgi:hypothetical protein
MMKQLLPFPFLLLMLIPFGTALSQGSLKHEWSKSLSNTVVPGGYVEGRAITTDAAGNIYVTGRFRDRNDFDPGPGYLQLTSNGNEDIYFAKYSSTGTLLFAKSFGSTGFDEVYSIALDNAGNIYLSGAINGATDFDPGSGVSLIGATSLDIFFAKYTPAGDLLFARRVGGTGVDRALSMAVDPATGTIYLAGQYAVSVDFDPGPATATLTASSTDGFFARYDANGNYVFARRIGGTSDDQAEAIKIDASGNIYVAGAFQSTADFDPGAGTANLISAGSQDAFLAKYNPNGLYLFANRMGSTSTDIAKALAVDATGQVIISGEYRGVVDFGPDPLNHRLTSVGNSDVFIAKYDTNGDCLYARSIGGTNNDFNNSLALVGTDVIIAGQFSGTADYNPGAGTTNLISAGSNDGYVARYTNSGALVFAYSTGSTSADGNFAVAATSTGIVYTTGFFSGTIDLDPGAGVREITAGSGATNGFFAGYSSNGTFTTGGLMGGLATSATALADLPKRIRADAAGNVYLCGIFQGSVDFDPGPGTTVLTSSGGNDIFFAKYNSSGALLFAKSMGAATEEDVTDMLVDAAGNIYLAGYFKETVDFDPGTGTTNLTSAGGDDLFFAKYDASGNLVLARIIGGAGDDRAFGLAVDAGGNIYVSGFFMQTVDFDPGAGTTSLTASGSSDIFFAKFNSSGNFLLAKNIGSSYNSTFREVAYGITTDASGNIYITGCFIDAADFDPGAGTTILTSFTSGVEDLFLAKYDANGNYVFAVKAGSGSADQGRRIQLDGSGNIFVSGLNSSNIFLLKYNSAGAEVFGHILGSSSFDIANDMAVDASGNVLITGEFTGTVDFSQSGRVFELRSTGNSRDLFVAKFSPTGLLEYAYGMGGLNSEVGFGIATGANNRVYLCGSFAFSATAGFHGEAPELVNSNGADAFFASYTDCTPQLPASFREGAANIRGVSRIIANDCGLLATLEPSTLTGSVSGKVWVESGVPVSNGNPYVARHYEITPAVEASTATYTVILYFTQAEFDAFNNHPGSTLNLPSNPTDFTGINNLRIGRFTGTSSNGTGLPESYTGTATVIDPSLNWNASSNLWEVIFSTTGGGGFIVQTRTDIITSLRNEPAVNIPGVQIYPNPVQSNLQVQLPVAVAGRRIQLRLMDLQGRIVKTWQPATGATLLSLPVGDLPAGTYLLELHDGQRQRQVTKILKQ